MPPIRSTTWRTIASPSPEPGIDRVAAEEALKDKLAILRRNAWSRIGDCQLRHRRAHLAKAYSYRTARRTPLGGIVEHRRTARARP